MLDGTSTTIGEHVWFCIRSQPKREHIAARNLSHLHKLEFFNPQLRQRKLTRRGPVWFVESLFPNYLFVKFALREMLEEVKFTPGVSHVVHFGDRYPVVPDRVIEELQKNFDGDHLLLSPESPSEGDDVTVTDPRFFGMEATVLRVLPAKQRVQVLLDMLGRTTLVELSLSQVMAQARQLPRNLVSGAMMAR